MHRLPKLKRRSCIERTTLLANASIPSLHLQDRPLQMICIIPFLNSNYIHYHNSIMMIISLLGSIYYHSNTLSSPPPPTEPTVFLSSEGGVKPRGTGGPLLAVGALSRCGQVQRFDIMGSWKSLKFRENH